MVRGVTRSLAATGELLELVDKFVAEHGLSERLAFAARLVSEELFANMVRHNTGGADRIDVELTIEKGVLRLVMRDYGVEAFDGSRNRPADVTSPIGERTAGGLGIHFVRSFFDKLEYDNSEGTMTVTASRYIGRRDV